jgi:glycosyltransferase involved in cell wall biosynthesis
VLRFFKSRKKKKLSDIERLLIDEFQAFSKIKHLHNPGSDEHSFHLASSIGHAITFAFTQQFIRNIEKGRLVDSIQSISSILPIILGLAPYLTAFAAQHKDNKLLKNLERHFHIGCKKPIRAAWFTDTFDDINGVSNTIHTVAKIAKQKSQDITVITSLKEKPMTDFPVQNFQPIGIFDLPEYESQKVAFPPFLNIIEFIENQQFNQIIISTPGPVGLVGLLAAKLLNINIKGMYHTDFPQYVRHLTDDDYMEEVAWKYVLWFYGCMEKVLVPSRFYFEQLESRGIECKKIDILSRGVDRIRFNPTKRDVGFWAKYNINGGFKFLYVGRVSVEKNLENLLTAFYIVKQKLSNINLVIVGEGPSFETFKSRFKHSDIVWTGYLKDEALSCVYASSDVFVFPSMTDTFGNVVLEAHSSGLPAIVSDKGGPAEIVKTYNSGIVVDARLPSNIAQAMEQIYGDELLRTQLKNNALKKAQESGWDEVLNKLMQT